MYINSFEIRYIIKSLLLIEILFFTNFFYIKLYFLYLEEKIEFTKIEYYFTICNENRQKKKIINKNKKPNISIISPIFNREKYISRFIKSVQNQNFDNIELIFVDDNSNDNSVTKIENYEKEDERIILIKNKKKKGTLICRNLGVLYSKGNYLILPDPDDIISKNILNICYKYAVKYQLEIIRFNTYKGKRRFVLGNIYKQLEKKTIYQPKLKSYLFYGKGELNRIDSSIHNKFIKRDTFIRALNILNKFYLNMYMIFGEDVIMNFSLYSTANSFFFLKQIGYFYIPNTKSITRNLINLLKLKDFMIELKFIFEYYKNTKYERDISNTILKYIDNNYVINSNIIEKCEINELSIYYNILKQYLNCKYITNDNKKTLKNIITIIEIKIKKHN